MNSDVDATQSKQIEDLYKMYNESKKTDTTTTILLLKLRKIHTKLSHQGKIHTEMMAIIKLYLGHKKSYLIKQKEKQKAIA